LEGLPVEKGKNCRFEEPAHEEREPRRPAEHGEPSSQNKAQPARKEDIRKGEGSFGRDPGWENRLTIWIRLIEFKKGRRKEVSESVRHGSHDKRVSILLPFGGQLSEGNPPTDRIGGGAHPAKENT